MIADIPKNDYDYIKRLAWKVHKKSFTGVEFDDLFQEGILAYLSAKQRYDKNKNDFYMGFVFKRVYGAMLDWVEKQAYNGRAAVRNIKNPDYKVVPIPEDYETLHYSDEIEKYMQLQVVSDKLMKIITKYLTDFEINLLYDYFIIGNCYSKYKSIFKKKTKMEEFIKTLIIFIKEAYEKGV